MTSFNLLVTLFLMQLSRRFALWDGYALFVALWSLLCPQWCQQDAPPSACTDVWGYATPCAEVGAPPYWTQLIDWFWLNQILLAQFPVYPCCSEIKFNHVLTTTSPSFSIPFPEFFLCLIIQIADEEHRNQYWSLQYTVHWPPVIDFHELYRG